jgi:hypothetical protein
MTQPPDLDEAPPPTPQPPANLLPPPRIWRDERPRPWLEDADGDPDDRFQYPPPDLTPDFPDSHDD